MKQREIGGRGEVEDKFRGQIISGWFRSSYLGQWKLPKDFSEIRVTYTVKSWYSSGHRTWYIS